jgi:hypothetical protein
VNSVLLAGGMTVLNGIDPPMDFDTRLGAWELALVAGVHLDRRLGEGRNENGQMKNEN